MGLKNDAWIAKMAMEYGMIEPFHAKKIRHVPGYRGGYGVVSFGLSSYGYDISLSSEVKVFVPKPERIIDPKNFPVEVMEDIPQHINDQGAAYVDIPPHSFALCRTVEYFRVPPNVLCVCLGKSTYARCSLILNTTPFEPGWCGYVTLEITNSNPLPARIYINEGIGQVLFFEGDDPPQTGYGEGKYQNQQARIVTAKV